MFWCALLPYYYCTICSQFTQLTLSHRRCIVSLQWHILLLYNSALHITGCYMLNTCGCCTYFICIQCSSIPHSIIMYYMAQHVDLMFEFTSKWYIYIYVGIHLYMSPSELSLYMGCVVHFVFLFLDITCIDIWNNRDT